MEELTFHLENFEGPLDLLLALISKNKMDLHDIPILALIDQYVELIEQFKAERLEVTSAFIEMAARLVEMKSFLLLPRNPEAERMKQELTGELIEYELCKRKAEELRQRSTGLYLAVRQPLEVEQDMTYTIFHSAWELPRVWAAMLGRSRLKEPPRAERFDPLVTAPFVSVSSRVIYVLRGLLKGRVQALQELFSKEESRSTTVATFLALLELVRHGRVTIDEGAGLSVKRGRLERREVNEGTEWT